MHARFLIRRGIAAIALVLLSNAGFAADTAKIDQGELVKRMEREDDKLLIVDVRTPEEFAAGHVPGAINIPYTYLPAQAASLASRRRQRYRALLRSPASAPSAPRRACAKTDSVACCISTAI